MTFLAGQPAGSTPDTASPQSNGGDVFWFRATAVATGTATTVQLRIGDWAVGTANGVKVVIYDSGGNRLGISGIFSSADGTGLLSKSISCSITNGQDYDILIAPDTGYVSCVRYTDLTGITMSYVSAGGFSSYASPPATIPSAAGTLSRFPYEVWLDGTTGGGGSTAGRNRMLMGFG